MFRFKLPLAAAALSLLWCAATFAQSPSVLYTWDGANSVDLWAKNFGTNTVTLDNNTVGVLTIAETGTAGEDVAIRDDFNRIRESSTVTGGLDLTGLDYLEFDLGHNGAGNVNVQFYVQATPSSTYVALGPDVAVTPGVSTYQLPLSSLTAAQQVYIRTVGFSIRDHLGEGNLTWSVEEVRSSGTPLNERYLVTHDVGTSDSGLQGAIANFTQNAILGNDGGQNQTGLSHNSAGPGSLQWTDLGDHGASDPSGAAVTWGNGTAWNGSSSGERPTDVSNYKYVTVRMKATDPLDTGGSLGVQAFLQTGGSFTYQSAGDLFLPIDGQFHELTYPLASITGREYTQWTGLNLFSHTNDLVIDVDYILYHVPEPSTVMLLGIACVACLGASRRVRRKA